MQETRERKKVGKSRTRTRSHERGRQHEKKLETKKEKRRKIRICTRKRWREEDIFRTREREVKETGGAGRRETRKARRDKAG